MIANINGVVGPRTTGGEAGVLVVIAASATVANKCCATLLTFLNPFMRVALRHSVSTQTAFF